MLNSAKGVILSQVCQKHLPYNWQEMAKVLDWASLLSVTLIDVYMQQVKKGQEGRLVFTSLTGDKHALYTLALSAEHSFTGPFRFFQRFIRSCNSPHQLRLREQPN